MGNPVETVEDPEVGYLGGWLQFRILRTGTQVNGGSQAKGCDQVQGVEHPGRDQQTPGG
jgi:hypothetical protein